MFKQNFEMAFGQVMGATAGFVVVAGVAYLCYKATNNTTMTKKDNSKKESKEEN